MTVVALYICVSLCECVCVYAFLCKYLVVVVLCLPGMILIGAIEKKQKNDNLIEC